MNIFKKRNSTTTLTPKGIATTGSGRVDFDFKTVLWMRPNCSLEWFVELHNSYGSLAGTAQVDGQCRFTIANLPDGAYTYQLKLRESPTKTTTYRTENTEVMIRNGASVTVEIDAVGKN